MRLLTKSGYVKHLSAERSVRVTSLAEDVEHVCVIRKPREYSRLNLREIAHDELVTLGSQVLSEFALHARSILGLPIPEIRLLGPAHSVALLGHLDGVPIISGVAEALAVAESQLRLFGKPECHGHRRLGVAIASGETPDLARERARAMAACIQIAALE